MDRKTANVNGITHPYEQLTPDVVLNAIEAFGLRVNGQLLALNSYENRVYQVGVEDSAPVVAKFYRPARWPDEAILEEHAFARELADREIPVVAPMENTEGETLCRHAGFRYAVFPRKGGRWPELEDPETRLRIGRFIGRIHAVGAIAPFRHRPRIDLETFGREPLNFLLAGEMVPAPVRAQYRDLAESLLEVVQFRFEAAGAVGTIRLHGDCHPGNILWTEQGAHFVDLDDCRSGPAVQDLWMLLSGDRRQMSEQLSDLLEGYEEFHDFDRRELQLIEPLRTLRLIHYAAWLARRWDDPAFPHNFPWFATPRYWDEQILALREQAHRLGEAPLVV